MCGDLGKDYYINKYLDHSSVFQTNTDNHRLVYLSGTYLDKYSENPELSLD